MKKLIWKYDSKYFDAQIKVFFQQMRNIHGNLSYSYYGHVAVIMCQACNNFIYYFVMYRFGYKIV